MSANATSIGQKGGSVRMNVNNHDDANFWAQYVGCTPEELWSAVTAVGADSMLVRAEIAANRVRGVQLHDITKAADNAATAGPLVRRPVAD